MQFKRNRRIMLAQDIVLVCLIPILCFFCIGTILGIVDLITEITSGRVTVLAE